jgi:uncharacterized protein
MTTAPSNTPGATPAWKPLAPNQRRVLGVLIEKAKTTPAGYPMSVNAIVVGCNQKSNRDPLMNLDDIDVSNTLVELERLGAVSEVDWVGRVPKYKHRAYEWLGVERVELAVMGEFLLRGVQSMGDLRVRAARMEPIADLTALKPIVEGLIARNLMIEITAPGRGQMVSHNLYSEPERKELRARSPGSSGHAAASGETTAAAKDTAVSGVGKFRCIVMNVTDMDRGERFWMAMTGLPLRFSRVGHPTAYSRLGDITSHSILLQLVTKPQPAPSHNAHLDLTVDDVDVAVQQALALGATMFREKGSYPIGADRPYLEWAVMLDPFGNKFCLIKDLSRN